MNTTCPSALTLSMLADRELSVEETVATESHLATCANCRAQLAALRGEARIIAAALAHDARVAPVPAYQRPVSAAVIAAAASGIVLVAALMSAAPSLLSDLLPRQVAWFNPFDMRTIIDVAIRSAIYLTQHGGAMMISLAQIATTLVVGTLLIWIAFVLRRRVRGPLLLTALVAAVVLQPMPSQALDIRHAEDGVFVAAGETIDDTLIAFGETVEIDGDVSGDVIAMGRRVVIRGHVGGQVFAAAQSVTIDGEVDGSVFGAGRDISVSSSRIGRNLIGAGATIDLNPGARVGQNVMAAGEQVKLAGSVGRDALGAAENIEVSGAIAGALTGYANGITLLAPARIDGNVTAYLPQADHLTVSPSAVVGGEVKTIPSGPHRQESRYATGGFYMLQLLRFAAALVTGAILFALVPRMRRVAPASAGDALVAGGVGLVTLVATPIIAVLVAITVVGIPIAVAGMFVWGVGIYLAKVVVAHFVGARLVETSGNARHFTLALAVGLLLVIVLVNLPFVGGVLNFLLTILGLGLLVLFGWRAYRGTSTGEAV